VAVAPGVVSTFAGSGSHSSAAGTGASASFKGPSSTVVVGGFAYVADNDAIMRVDVSSGAVSVFAGSPNAASCVAGTSGSTSRVSNPQGLTTDGYYLYFYQCAAV
jgi:hypothetical protein